MHAHSLAQTALEGALKRMAGSGMAGCLKRYARLAGTGSGREELTREELTREETKDLGIRSSRMPGQPRSLTKLLIPLMRYRAGPNVSRRASLSSASFPPRPHPMPHTECITVLPWRQTAQERTQARSNPRPSVATCSHACLLRTPTLLSSLAPTGSSYRARATRGPVWCAEHACTCVMRITSMADTRCPLSSTQQALCGSRNVVILANAHSDPAGTVPTTSLSMAASLSCRSKSAFSTCRIPQTKRELRHGALMRLVPCAVA